MSRGRKKPWEGGLRMGPSAPPKTVSSERLGVVERNRSSIINHYLSLEEAAVIFTGRLRSDGIVEASNKLSDAVDSFVAAVHQWALVLGRQYGSYDYNQGRQIASLHETLGWHLVPDAEPFWLHNPSQYAFVPSDEQAMPLLPTRASISKLMRFMNHSPNLQLMGWAPFMRVATFGGYDMSSIGGGSPIRLSHPSGWVVQVPNDNLPKIMDALLGWIMVDRVYNRSNGYDVSDLWYNLPPGYAKPLYNTVTGQLLPDSLCPCGKATKLDECDCIDLGFVKD